MSHRRDAVTQSILAPLDQKPEVKVSKALQAPMVMNYSECETCNGTTVRGCSTWLQNAALMQPDIVHTRVRCHEVCLLVVVHALRCDAAVWLVIG